MLEGVLWAGVVYMLILLLGVLDRVMALVWARGRR